MQFETLFDVAQASSPGWQWVWPGVALLLFAVLLRSGWLKPPEKGSWAPVLQEIMQLLRRHAAWIGGAGLLLAVGNGIRVVLDMGEIRRVQAGQPVSVVEGRIEAVTRHVSRKRWIETLTVGQRSFSWGEGDTLSPYPLTGHVRSPEKGMPVRLTLFEDRIVRIEVPLCRVKAPCRVHYLGGVRVELTD